MKKVKLLIFLLLLLMVKPSFAAAPLATLILPEAGVKKVVYSGSQEAQKYFKLGYILLQGKNMLGSVAPSTGYSERLAQTITNSSTTIYVSSTLDRDGVVLPLSSTNKGYFTLEPGTSREESIVCTAASSTVSTISGCTRGLAASGSSEIGSVARAYSHNAGSKIIMTDIAQFFGNFVDIFNNQDISGVKNFLSLPTSSTSTPTLSSQLVTKSYADALITPSSYWTLSGGNIYRPTGYVGISNTNPTSPLTVTGTSTLISSGQATGSWIDFQRSDGVAIFRMKNGASSDGDFVFAGNTGGGFVDMFTIKRTSGNIGIGTTNPAKTLDITGTLGVSATSTFAGASFSAIPTIPTTTPTTAGQVVALSASAKLPAVDGSNLTNLTRYTSIGTSTSLILNAGSSGTYADIDVSAITGARASLLFLKVSCSGSGGKITFRRNGETDTFEDINSAGTAGYMNSLQFANAGYKAYAMVDTDSAGVFEYKYIAGSNCSVWLQGYIN